MLARIEGGCGRVVKMLEGSDTLKQYGKKMKKNDDLILLLDGLSGNHHDLALVLESN